MNKTLEANLQSLSCAERKETIGQLDSIITEIDKYRASYWWTPAQHASVRHSKAFSTNVRVPLGTDVITFQSSYYESCRNCYYTKNLYFSDRRTNITLLRNIVAKLKKLNSNNN